MNALLHSANLWAGHLRDWAWPMLWQSSLLIGLVWILDAALRRRVRGAVRYALWLLVLLKLLLPPSLAVPTGLAWWVRSTPVPPVPRYQTRVVTVAAQNDLGDFPAPSGLPAFWLPRTNPEGLSRSAWACLTSGSVSLALLAWVLFRWGSVVSLGRRGSPAPPALLNLLEEERRRAGCRIRVILRLTDQAMSPAVYGVLRPVILLPRALVDQLSPEALRPVLLHELIHLRRGDVWVSWAQALLQIVYWWHPLVWVANACIRRTREEAVDDAVVVTLKAEAGCYALTLLAVARLGLPRSLAALGLVGILESRSALRRRIERLVHLPAPRTAGLTLTSGLCVMALAAFAVPMGEAPSPAAKAQPAPPAVSADQPAFRAQAVLPEKSARGEFFTLQSLIHERTAQDQKIAEAQAALDKLLGDASLIGSAQAGTAATSHVTVETWRQLSKMRLECQTEYVRQKTLLDRLQSLGPDELVQVLPTVAHDDLLDYLLKQQTVADQKLSEAEKDYGPQHSEVIHAKLVVEDFKRKLIQRVEGIMTGLTVKADSLGRSVTNLIHQLEQAAQDIQKTDQSKAFLEAKRRLNDLESFRAGLDAKIASKTFASLRNTPTASHSAPGEGTAHPIIRTEDWPGSNGSGVPAASTLSAKDRAAVFQDGKLFYEMGKLDEAEAQLRGAQKADPDNRSADYYLTLIQQARLNRAPLAQPDPYSRSNLVWAGPRGRQDIYHKLDTIMLTNVGPWLRLSLARVTSILTAESRKLDPERKGINFIINPGTDKATEETVELSEVGIQIDSPLAALRLADLLDVIVKCADKPIKYSIEDYAVVFSPKGREAAPLYFRTIQLDPNKFNAGLSNAVVTAGLRLPDDWWGAMRAYFSSLGVDLSPPKALYYKDLQGTLLVYATLPELDTIEKAVGATYPPRAWPTNGLLPPPWTNSPIPHHTVTNLDGRRADAKTPGVTNAEGLQSAPRVALPLGEKLFFRTIKVDPNTFVQGLSNSVTFGGSVLVDSAPLDLRRQTPAELLSMLLRKFFAGLGVNLDPPKTMFFNDRGGTLLIYASLHDLDIIERAVQVLNTAPPQVNLKARFISLPEAEVRAFMAQYAPSNSTPDGAFRLTPSQTRKLIQRWQGMDGVDLLSESQVTTLSGRQAQIQTVDLKTVVSSDGAASANSANGSRLQIATNQIPVGPALDIIPRAAGDGFAVQLGLIATVSEFLGYDDPGQFVVAMGTTSGLSIPITAQVPLPHFRIHQQTAAVSVWDGQSVVLGGLEIVDLVGKFRISSQANRSHIIVLVTPTLIDAAGNRYHAQDEMPFTETSFPPQAKSTPMPPIRDPFPASKAVLPR